MTVDCRERFVTTRSGSRVFVADWGDPLDPRAPVLGLPGYARTTKDFAHIAERIAPRRLVCLDYRGRGRSDYESDPDAYAPPLMLDDVRAVMIALGLHRVVVIGTSFGGMLAMALAVAAPTVLAGVVLNDVGPDVSDAGGAMLIEIMGRDRRPATWEAAAVEMRQILPDLSLRTDAEWDAFARATYREEPDGTLRQDWDPAIVKPLAKSGAREADLWSLFAALTATPTLLVHGGKSIVLSADTVTRMRARHPAMEVLTLAGVGHAPTLDEPEARAALDRFLARV
jgi:pimeloyl-ACP methyl ester carboxylesterase